MKHLKTLEEIYHSIEDLKKISRKEKKLYSDYKYKMNDHFIYIENTKDKSDSFFIWQGFYKNNEIYKISSIDILYNKNDAVYGIYDKNDNFITYLTEEHLNNNFIKLKKYEIDSIKYNL